MAPKLSMVLSQPIDKIVEDQGPSLSFVIVFKIWKAYLQQTQNQMTQQSPNWRPNNVPNHPVNLIEMPPPPCPPQPKNKEQKVIAYLITKSKNTQPLVQVYYLVVALNLTKSNPIIFKHKVEKYTKDIVYPYLQTHQ